MSDFLDSEVGRRQSWYGTKRYVKRGMSWRVPHAAMRATLRVRPDLASPRLPAPASVKEVQGRVGDVTFWMLRPDRCEIAKELYWGNGRRPRREDALALDVFVDLARDSTLVLDVGAYTGIFSVASALANPAADVHAFEVVPDVYVMLFGNCVRNNILKQVTCHHVGIGRPGQTARFPAHSTGSALPSFYSASTTFTDGVDIRFLALDELLPLVGEDAVGLMKIDVEGTEGDIFDHGRELLAALRPDILCEILPDSTAAPRITEALEGLGYRFYVLGEPGLVPRQDVEPDPRFRDWLFSSRPPERLSRYVR